MRVYIQDVYHYIMNRYITQLIVVILTLCSQSDIVCVLVVQQPSTCVFISTSDDHINDDVSSYTTELMQLHKV